MSGNVNFEGTDEEWDALVEKNKLRLSSMKKQTAVEWLVNELIKKGFPIEKYGDDLYNQSKAMEKEQIEAAFYDGCFDTNSWRAEQYYTSTYE